MSKSHETVTDSDVISVDDEPLLPSESHDLASEEINTYDTIPITESKDLRRKASVIKRLYSIVAVLTLLLSVIFSSAELLDVMINDTGAGNMILRRIFGTGMADNSFDLSELIISNSFLIISDDIPAEKETSPKPEISEPDTPKQESAAPDKPPVNEPDDSTKEETKPPSSESPDQSGTPEALKYPILAMDMSLLSYGENYIYNNTSLTPDIDSLRNAKLKNYYTQDEPLILIVHTHGTESYMPEGAGFYTDDGELARSANTDENMIAVGNVFARVLEENGIKAIHCTVMHDQESYRDSYSRAAESIEKYLKQYPSIKYVFDLHRDSIIKADGELISAVSTIDGETHAQIMPVIGTGASDWEENMSFAIKLRDLLNRNYTNLCRPICLRESTYNQNMGAVSVLLEIGTSGNTLEEAKKAASLVAEAIVSLIKN